MAKLNDSDRHVKKVADFLARLRPTVAYVAIPTRPPAEEWAQPPDEDVVNRACHLLSEKAGHVEYLTGYEGDAFASTGNVDGDILSITAVHPMREDAVDAFLKRAGADWEVVRRLVTHGQLIEAEYGGHKFYLRRFRRRHGGREPKHALRKSRVLPGSESCWRLALFPCFRPGHMTGGCPVRFPRPKFT